MTFLQDVRFAVRLLLKNPGFTCVAVLSLALGIGANAAIFSLLDAMFLKPMPVLRPQELFIVQTYTKEFGPHADFSYPLYVDFRDRNDVFTGVAAYTTNAFALTAGEQSERVAGELVTSNFSQVLGVPPYLGSWFSGSDELEGAAPVVVLSHGLWKRMFGADPSVVNKVVQLNGRSATVIGVAPPDFHGMTRGMPADLWLTVAQFPVLQNERPGLMKRYTTSWLALVARLKPGIAPAVAAERMTAAARSFPADQPSPDWSVVLLPAAAGDRDAVESFERPLRMLMLAVIVVLLIACANLANLLLKRARAREREVGIRTALGATRYRIIRQFLTESLLLASLGALLGLLLATWTSRLLVLRTTSGQALAVNPTTDYRVLAFTIAVSALAAVLFGIVPAWRSSHTDVVSTLKQGGENTSLSRRRALFGNSMVVVQVALSLVLVVAAGLFLRSLRNLRSLDLGFAADQVVAATVNLRLMGYDEPRAQNFYAAAIQRLERLPGVRSASFGYVLPATAGGMRTQSPGSAFRPQLPDRTVSIDLVPVAPRFFETIGLPLLRGREFRPADGPRAAKVIIVNQTMAQKFWPGADPIGRSFQTSDGIRYEVIGIARNTKYRDLREAPKLTMYLPVTQLFVPAGNLLVRASGRPADIYNSIRRELRTLDPALPVYNLRTAAEHIARSLYLDRLRASLLSVFGGLALLLAAIGVYGVIAYGVAQRTREIGIRMALGADPLAVLAMVLRGGLRLVAIGVVAGLVAAFWLSRLVQSQLYSVRAHDPFTYAASAAVLLGAATVAMLLPARRAARVDPMVALRSE